MLLLIPFNILLQKHLMGPEKSVSALSALVWSIRIATIWKLRSLYDKNCFWDDALPVVPFTEDTCPLNQWRHPAKKKINNFSHGSLNVPIDHHPTIRYMVYNGYYKVMSNIPKMGQLPTSVSDFPESWFPFGNQTRLEAFHHLLRWFSQLSTSWCSQIFPPIKRREFPRFPPISPGFPRPSRPAPPIGDKRPRCRSVCRSIPTWFFDGAQRGARSHNHPKLVETLQATGKIWSQNATGLLRFFWPGFSCNIRISTNQLGIPPTKTLENKHGLVILYNPKPCHYWASKWSTGEPIKNKAWQWRIV